MGKRWLFRKFRISLNGYYNFLKDRKADYQKKKVTVMLKISARLAVESPKIAIKRYLPGKGLLLHSDQGSQFTSKEFNDFHSNVSIQQSMSRAGCPYDNAPMERYYNTLKNERIYLFSFKTKEDLDRSVNEFAYDWYNHVRPHSYNGGLTPCAARVA